MKMVGEGQVPGDLGCGLIFLVHGCWGPQPQASSEGSQEDLRVGEQTQTLAHYPIFLAPKSLCSPLGGCETNLSILFW